MTSTEFENLKEALRQPATPEAMREAAQSFREYERVKRLSGRPNSKPTLVSLGFKKAYPTQIDIRDIPGELERNPAFFEYMRNIVGEG